MPPSRGCRGVGALAFGLALATLVLAGCGGGTTRTPLPSAMPPAMGPTSPASGVITGIESTGLNAVHGFTLRTTAGSVLRFRLGNLDNPTQFPPGHLAEHQLTGVPVLVFFRVEGADLVVYHLEDAPVR